MEKSFLTLLLILSLTCIVKAQTESQHAVSASHIRNDIITNPVTPAWIKSHLKKNAPRLIFTEEREKVLRQKIKQDSLVHAYYAYLHHYADEICTKPVLERTLIGKRLLGVSTEAVRRIGILALVYRVEHDKKYLDRLAKEIDAVSAFSDWHPDHFLDVAEMSYAVAIGLDWAGKSLPASTVKRLGQL